MRILIISFYYPPDIGPGSFRAKSIVDALVDKEPSVKIDVLTAMPNRYQFFNKSAKKKENKKKVNIYRINVPKHKNGIIDQVKAFLFFSYAVKEFVKKKKWDIVVVTSSRLMSAFLGAWIAKKKNSKFYLDIRDLFSETINDLYSKNILRIFMPFIYWIEKWTFCAANKINLASEGFLDYVKKINPNSNPTVYTNGTDEIIYKNDFSINLKQTNPVILYAGNFGRGQGLHKIIPNIAKNLKGIKFKLIGDGSERKILFDKCESQLKNNIKILKPMKRKELIKEYHKADILFLHLDNYDVFKKVLPSKIFEYASTGKPILAGVSGYASKFLIKKVKGVEVFHPCDTIGMEKSIKKLLCGPKIFNRKKFCELYDRKKITKKMVFDILSMTRC